MPLTELASNLLHLVLSGTAGLAHVVEWLHDKVITVDEAERTVNRARCSVGSKVRNSPGTVWPVWGWSARNRWQASGYEALTAYRGTSRCGMGLPAYRPVQGGCGPRGGCHERPATAERHKVLPAASNGKVKW